MIEDNIVNFPSRPEVAVRYRETHSFEQGGEDASVTLAVVEGHEDVVHVVVRGQHWFEPVASYRNTEIGQIMAKQVGEAVAKAMYFAAIYDDEPDH